MHWTDHYIGRPHVRGQYDCSNLVQDVSAEVFNTPLRLPQERDISFQALSDLIDSYAPTVLEPATSPRDGDVVLMRNGPRRLAHVGIYVVINGVAHVLHNLARAGTCLHALYEFGSGMLMNLSIEGYYRIKPE